jgi:hypothetical protein
MIRRPVSPTSFALIIGYPATRILAISDPQNAGCHWANNPVIAIYVMGRDGLGGRSWKENECLILGGREPPMLYKGAQEAQVKRTNHRGSARM